MKLIRSLFFCGLCVISLGVHSKCQSSVFNPVTDIAWENIFPVTMGGIIELGSNPKYATGTGNLICTCAREGVPVIGIKVGFWEPARIVDTVLDAYCMMPLGVDMGATGMAGESASGIISRERNMQFNQAHWYIFPALALMDLFLDLPCVDYQRDFDVAIMTELLLTWNDDQFSSVINPESLLVANPVAQTACIADATSVLAWKPVNHLYWCAGNHSVYPMGGRVNGIDSTENGFATASKMIHMMGRLGLLWEYRKDGCGLIPSTMWTKDQWRIQLAKPVRQSEARYPGVPGTIWTSMTAPPYSNNQLWVLFRLLSCCVGGF